MGIPHADGGVKTKNTKEEKMGITLPCPDGRVKSRSHEYLYDPMVLSGVDKLASILNIMHIIKTQNVKVYSKKFLGVKIP